MSILPGDDAGQFNILNYGLCGVHAERLIHKLIPLNEHHRDDQQAIQTQIWDFYADLEEVQSSALGGEKSGAL